MAMRTERFLELSNRRLDDLFDMLEVAEGELTPDIEQELQMLIDTGEAAIIDCVRMIQNFNASIKTSKLWEQRRRDRRKRQEEWVSRLRAIVTDAMEKRGVERIEDPETGDKVRTQKSQPKLEYDADLLPKEFIREKVVYEVDTARLKAYLELQEESPLYVTKDGDPKVAARLVRGKHIVIW